MSAARATTYTPALNSSRTQVSSATYQEIKRQRMERNIAPPLRRVAAQPVADTTDGVEQLRRIRVVDFAPQRMDMHVDQIRDVVELVVPDVLGNRLARD